MRTALNGHELSRPVRVQEQRAGSDWTKPEFEVDSAEHQAASNDEANADLAIPKLTEMSGTDTSLEAVRVPLSGLSSSGSRVPASHCWAR